MTNLAQISSAVAGVPQNSLSAFSKSLACLPEVKTILNSPNHSVDIAIYLTQNPYHRVHRVFGPEAVQFKGPSRIGRLAGSDPAHVGAFALESIPFQPPQSALPSASDMRPKRQCRQNETRISRASLSLQS
jgi:hypothetical protein